MPNAFNAQSICITYDIGKTHHKMHSGVLTYADSYFRMPQSNSEKKRR